MSAGADDKALIPLKGIRGMIARSLTAAWQAPRVAQGLDADMTEVLARVAREREATGRKISITHAVLRAVALALREHPTVNGVVTEQGVELWSQVNLGVAVNTVHGVVVPVLTHADGRTLESLESEVARLAEGARAGKLPASAYQRGTFTVSTLGATGIDWFTPVLNPPQVAILGVGRVAQRAVVVDDMIVARPMMTLTLVFDHRALDGHPAGLFLSDVARRLGTGDF
jgi:pyruvate/2-oxoglutarate dehydrogenase complex dihydrolipoamide acyltransferase (E2) component